MKAKTPLDVEFGYTELAKTIVGFTGIPILGFSVAAISRCEGLFKLKLNIGRNDLRIAAIALEAGGVVVTRKLRHFSKVPGLMIQDWSV